MADRIVITDSPSNVDNSEAFTITVEDMGAIQRIAGVRSGALTHAVNNDMCFVNLGFTVIDSNTIQVITFNTSIIIPGT
ncbi:hypothetical protein [Rubripirellula reticaptiva]|uniref:Uncharacterized protein n=1 Tax=Rubripirellula reticaptiva TaxID=2528013 RepID=A0A5C6FFM4_9BACT|nr:hypothetical protein [Rubripirellula reticaptiva]TWU58401.1 hypothetical protein Poly59_13120 [Rubripirellula reticaptiva]